MKIIGVIPARYGSSRLEGKPLADIDGKPMIWWVYNQVKKVKRFDEIYVATDDERIKKVCDEYKIKVLMTKKNHPNHISRIHEVSTKIEADYYVCVNGDEPLISPENIKKIIPNNKSTEIVIYGIMREMNEPSEVIDISNIKIATNNSNQAIYMSRSSVPNPKGTLLFKYKKYVGIECFNKPALNFFVKTKQGMLEKTEDIDHLRFIENGHLINFIKVKSDSISVDTQKDLEKVRKIIEERKKNNE